nr:hypothetical protein [uncultured Allomuricauda sp.]
MKNYLIILALSSFLFACKSQKISNDDRKWQPYLKGDVLIFKSNENKKDSIFINKIESYNNPKDPLGASQKKYESLFISGEVSLKKPIKTRLGHTFNKERIDILEMVSDSNQTFIKFVFNKKSDSLKYPITVLTLDSLKKRVNGDGFVKIDAKEYYDLSFDYDLKSFIWNKKYGYTRFNLKNGTYWELEEFLRKDKNILD